MVNGYKPSVARVYDPGDAGIHFSHFAAEDDCVLLFMAEGAATVAKATADGIQAIVDQHPECTQVPSEYIETWFNDLCWDASKITAEDERIRQTRNVNRTTEISADWSSINEIYQAAKARIIDEIPDITMMGGHSSHSYINGTNMYFNYFFNVVGVGPRGGDREVLPADHRHHLSRRRSSAAAPSSTITAWAKPELRGSRTSTVRPTTCSRR